MRLLIWIVIALLIAATAAWLGADAWRDWRAKNEAADIEQFLARHWRDPLPAQGDPPKGFSPIETSLAPEDCGVCHAAQYADWRTTLHARAIGPGILWQFALMEQGEANRCLRCHAPLAEQKALMALEQGWPKAPRGARPPYVSSNLHRQGLVCAACHVRSHERFGPPRQGPAPTGVPSHGGFVTSNAFEDSRFCSTCHQFAPDGRRVNGKLLENTYEEWRASAAARAGRSCQACHMPGRRHLWRGIHDAQTVDRSLRRELTVTRLDATTGRVLARLSPREVGHYFPTYVVPKLYVTLRLRCATCLDRELARHTIGRTLDVDLNHELADTRLTPDGELVLNADFAVPKGNASVELRVEVAPGEHYERMFAHWLEERLAGRLTPQVATPLREALQRARESRYDLEALSVPLPAQPGATQRTLAN